MKKLLIVLVLAMPMSAIAGIIAPTLGDIMSSGRTDVDTGDEVYHLTDTSGVQDDATAFLYLEAAGNANFNSFGIYEVGNIGSNLQIFDALAAPLLAATLAWDINTNEVFLTGTLLSAFIDYTDFGFYLDTKDDGRFFTESLLNPGGADLAGSFTIGGLGYNEFFGANIVLAFGDTLGGDLDYNDFVVGLSDVAPNGTVIITRVPEPMPLTLVGLGLIGIGFTRKYSN